MEVSQNMINLIRVFWGLVTILCGIVTFIAITIFGYPYFEDGVFTQIIAWSIFLAPISLIAAILLSFRNMKFLYLPLINIILFTIGCLGVEVIQHGRL